MHRKSDPVYSFARDLPKADLYLIGFRVVLEGSINIPVYSRPSRNRLDGREGPFAKVPDVTTWKSRKPLKLAMEQIQRCTRDGKNFKFHIKVVLQ